MAESIDQRLVAALVWRLLDERLVSNISGGGPLMTGGVSSRQGTTSFSVIVVPRPGVLRRGVAKSQAREKR